MQTLIHHLSEALGNGWTIGFTAFRVAVIYLVLLLAFRFLGRRVLAQMTPFDLLTLLLLSNAVQNAMIGPDNSLVGGLVGAAVLLGADRVIGRKKRLRRFFEGEPVVLISHGHLIEEHLKREGIDVDELLAALHEHGVEQIEKVEAAILEINGSISVVPEDVPTVHRLRKVHSNRNR
ncbi:MAG: DUF421 domain-containing protein [Firmicutes bacterium]|nr:DUF421 domain-containing protein [Bacillota bacterium]